MGDIGLSAFSVFFMQSPSFLAHQRLLAENCGRSNAQTLFGMTAIPCDNHIRQMLDGASTDHFDPVFAKVVRDLDESGDLSSLRRLDGRVLIALDGSEHFCSRKVNCPHCSTRKRSDGEIESTPGRPLPALPCCAPLSAALPPNWLLTPHLRAADWYRPYRCRGLSSSCSSLCAAESFALRMRPMAHSCRPPKGCRRAQGSIAVVPSFSIHLSLCSTGFHRLHRYYEEIRLLLGLRPVVVASFRSTAHADPNRSPWVKTLDVPPLPPPLPPRPRLDFGRRVWRHANPAGSACSGIYFRSVLRFASGFFPTRPHGVSVIASLDGRHCVQLPPARGCYQLAPQRTFTSNPVPMPGTPPLRCAPMALRSGGGSLLCTT